MKYSIKGLFFALLAGISWGGGLVFAFYPYLLLEAGGSGIFAGTIGASLLVHLSGSRGWPEWCRLAWRRKRVVIPFVLLLSFGLMALCLPGRQSLFSVLDSLRVSLSLREGIHWFLLSFSLVTSFRVLSFFFKWSQVLELAVLVLLIASPIYGPMQVGNAKPHWLFDHWIADGKDQSSKRPFWYVSAFAALPILCFLLSDDGRSGSGKGKNQGFRFHVQAGIVLVIISCLSVAVSFQVRGLIDQENLPIPPVPPPNPFEPPPPPQPPPIALVDLPKFPTAEPEGYYFRVAVIDDVNQSVDSLKFKPLALEREGYGSTDHNFSSRDHLLSKVYPYVEGVPQLLLNDAGRVSEIRPIPKGGFADAYLVESNKTDFSFRQAYGKYVGKTGSVIASLQKRVRYQNVIVGTGLESTNSHEISDEQLSFYRDFEPKLKKLPIVVQVYYVVWYLQETFSLSDEQGKEHEASPIQDFMGGDYNGSSAHFALAAYYWLQATDIPCRLVSGYFLPKKGDKVEDAARVLPAHERIWLEVYMGKRGILKSNPQWTPIFISPKVVLDQNQPEEPDDPPEPPDEEEEEQEKKSGKDPDSSAPTDGESQFDDLKPFFWVLGAIFLMLAVIRPVSRFYLIFPHKNQRATAMTMALRWLDLYGQRRKYGESFIDFASRLQKSLNLQGFEQMAWEHRREFANPDANGKDPGHWAGRLKELRESLRINESLETPKWLHREVLWKIFGFPSYPNKVQQIENKRS